MPTKLTLYMSIFSMTISIITLIASLFVGFLYLLAVFFSGYYKDLPWLGWNNVLIVSLLSAFFIGLICLIVNKTQKSKSRDDIAKLTTIFSIVSMVLPLLTVAIIGVGIAITLGWAKGWF